MVAAPALVALLLLCVLADCTGAAPGAVAPRLAVRRLSAAACDLQARLAACGFDPGAAVAAFQGESGLPASGDGDCATWQALLRGR
jgi:hypothetical protein